MTTEQPAAADTGDGDPSMKRHVLARILTVVAMVLLTCAVLAEQPEKPP